MTTFGVMPTSIEDQVSALKHQYEDRFREAGYPATVEINEDLTLRYVVFGPDQARHILPLIEGFERPAIPPEPLMDDPEVVAYNQRLRDTLVQRLAERVRLNLHEDGGVEINGHVFEFKDICTGLSKKTTTKLVLVRGVRACFGEFKECTLQVRKDQIGVTPEQTGKFLGEILDTCNVKIARAHL